MNKTFDHIRLQVMWARLLAVVEEQAQTLMRTAFSTVVTEAGDLSAGVFDLQGRMIAQAATGTPGHVNTMAETVRDFLREGVIRNAVNFPSVPAETFARLRPYLTLAERLGSLVAQMGEARRRAGGNACPA